MAGNAKISISVDGGDLAADVLSKVASAMRGATETTVKHGEAAHEAAAHTDTFFGSIERLGSGFAAHVAEGLLLRDAIEKVVDGVKEGIMAFPELVEHTIATGNSLFEMSLKTGASVENLSALRYVASQTGLDFDSFGNILFKMEQALGASGAKADEMQNHLNVLGLNLQTLKNEKPDQAFIDIMSALEEIPNRADQAAAGMAIFGKGFKEMAGLTQESITDLMDEAKDLGLVMSTETAAAAHAAEVGFKGFSMQLEAVGMEVAATVVPALVAVTKLVSGEFHAAVESVGHPIVDLKQLTEDVIMKMLDWSTVGIETAQFLDHAFEGTKAMLFDIEAKIVGVGVAFVDMALAAAKVADKIPGMRGDFTGLASSLQDTSTWLGGFQKGLKDESDGALDAAAKHDRFFNSLTAGIGDMKAHFGEAFEKTTKEIADFADKSHNAFGGVGTDVEGSKDKVDKYAEAWKNLSSIGSDYADTAAQIDPLLVAEISYYVDAGAKVTDLAAAYSDVLTPAQIDAIDKMVKANEKYAKSWQSTQQDIDRVWDNALSAERENGLKGLDLELAKLDRQRVNERDAAAKKITDETQLQEMLTAIDAKYDGLRGVAQQSNADKLTNEIGGLWTDLYATEATDGMTATEKQIASVKKWYDDKVTKAREAGVTDQTYYNELYALADRKTKDVIALNDPWKKANDTMRADEKKAWDTLLGDVYGGFNKTFSTDIVKALTGEGGFHDILKDLWKQIEGDITTFAATAFSNFLQGFIGPAESALGGWLAKLAGVGAGSGSTGSAGWLGLIASWFGHGGSPGSNTPVTSGYFDPDGNWVPAPAGGGDSDTGKAPTGPDPNLHEAEGGVIRARYMAGGGTFPGWAQGVDRVPVWMQEGEGVLNTRAMRNVGEPMLNHLNRGGEVLNTKALENEIKDLHMTMRQLANTIDRQNKLLPTMIASAVHLAH